MSLFLLLGAAILFTVYLRWVSPVSVLRKLGARPFDQSSILKNVKVRMRETAHRQRMPMPVLWILPEFSPNALVLRSRRRRLHIALTEGLVRSLSGDELDTALSLCLTHGYQRGRIWQTWVGMLFFPVTRLAQNYPFPAQLLFSPFISLLLRMAASPSRFLRADREAARHQSQLAVAAVLQKLSVVGTKIPVRNWNMALDSLFLISPLAMDESPLWLFLSQPSVEKRRSQLLAGMSCETSPSLT